MRKATRRLLATLAAWPARVLWPALAAGAALVLWPASTAAEPAALLVGVSRVAYHDQTLHREHMLKSLTPLYLGRTASFVLETQHGDSAEVDQTVESLCREFELSKSYLAEQWRWRDE